MAVANDACDGEEGDNSLVLTACLARSAVPHGDGIPKVLFGSGARGKDGSATATLIGDDDG